MRVERPYFSNTRVRFDLKYVFHKPYIAALLFTIILVIWEALIFHINYVDYIYKTIYNGYEVWDSTKIFYLIASIVSSLIVSFFFIYVSFRSERNTKIFCFLLFAFASVYEYGYYKSLSRFSTPEDILMAALFTDSTLFKDAILTYIDLKSFLPVTLYGFLLWKTQPKKYVSWTSILLVLSVACLFFSLLFRIWYLSQSAFPTTAFSGFLRAATFSPWKYANSYHIPRDPISFHAQNSPKNNIVFIVDESIRSDHLSLNGYSRSTTPYLQELMQQGLLYNWKDSSSAATCSLPSNNLLLTGITALPDTENRLLRQPSIFQYAKAMGYETSYIDDSNAIFWNGTRSDLQYIDHWENAQQFSDGALYDADTRMARHIRELVNGSTGHFIWVNKRGVHFFYNNTFPEGQAHWAPIMQQPTQDPSKHQEIVNSYDSGIYYNSENFFHTLIDQPSVLDHTIILYTSDHGQTLADHSETWTHCKDTHNEALVPLFLITKSNYQVDTNYKASHSNLFATLLDLLDFPEPERHYSYAPSLLRAHNGANQPRQYYFGSLDGSGAGRYIPFDR